MKLRSLIALLLVVAMSLAIAVHPIAARSRPGAPDEVQLQPEEEQEARELVARFSERWRATNDFGQILDELFVQDFPERLRQAPTNSIPWAFLDKSLAASASRNELRRYYVASMNFYALYFRLAEVAESFNQQAGKDEGKDEGEAKIEDILSPEIINILLSDPIIAELAQELQEEDENERAEEVESGQSAQSADSAPAADTPAKGADGATESSEIGIIKTHSQLDGVSATLEKAGELMRQRLASRPSIPPTPSSDDDQADSDQSSPKPYLTSLDEGEYGYPKGTPAIHVDSLPFCIHLIKIDGQLKILSVTIYVD